MYIVNQGGGEEDALYASVPSEDQSQGQAPGSRIRRATTTGNLRESREPPSSRGIAIACEALDSSTLVGM